MQIEEGKFCRTACGKRAGPMHFENGRWYGRMGRYKDRYDWGADGKWMSDGTPHNLDLVAEWEDPDPVALIRQMREALAVLTPASHGVYGGPFVMAKFIYEDGTDEDGARHKGAFAHHHADLARAALAAADEFLKA